MRKITFLLLTLLTTALSAQNNVIDEVIWVVGDEAIFRSEVEEERMRAQYEGQSIAGDPYCIIPEQIAIQKLFLHQAELDSIVPNESSVAHQVDARMNYYIQQIGSKEKMEEYFRKSAADIKEEMTTNVSNQMVIQQMQAKLTENIKPTPAEIRKYYNSLPKDSLPVIPEQVEVQILSFEPQVPIDETERIKSRLREFTERVNSGKGDFSMLARLYSEDTESAKRGGELGFVGRGQLVREFADVAFNLTDPKKVSRIVQTEYGYHIIQLIEKKGDRINCRHILLRPKVSYVDKQNSLARLDSIIQVVDSGKATFEQAVGFFSQDKTTAMNQGIMTNPNTGASKFEYAELPSEIAKAVSQMEVGQISKPFVMMDPSKNKEVIAVVKLRSRIPVHKADLKNDYQMIKNMLQNKKSVEYIHNWIIGKQKETYIYIDPNWAGCDFQYPGWIH